MTARLSSLLATLVIVATIVRPVRAQVDAEQVRLAIDRAVAFLKEEQRADGTWPELLIYKGGVTSLCALALLNAGVEPGDPHLQRALAYLRALKPEHTYTVSLQTMVLCAASPKEDLLLIRRNVKWLEETQTPSGGWSYPSGGGDNSNSQFALLALHEAERAGVEVSERTWKQALGYWERGQDDDGSWGYPVRGGGTGSMTCAGLAALIIAAGQLNQGDARLDADGQVRCCGEQSTNERIENALRWLEGSFAVDRNPGLSEGNVWLLYYLYGVERAGRLTARRFIGQHDWYREGAEFLVGRQDKLDGFWSERGHGGESKHVGTALGLLFMAKGRRPVMIGKLRFGEGNDWNRHRSDAANLTAYVEQKWRRDLTWQIVDARAASVDDLLQSPVLFLSGSQAPQFDAAEKQKLRGYVDRGGFIFAVACCGGEAFQAGFEKLVQELFPEPDARLHELSPRHALWRVEEPVDPRAVKLYGIDTCCRTSVVFCPTDLSCAWELATAARRQRLPAAAEKQIKLAHAVGINVMAYATNRELKYKYDVFAQGSGAADADKLERGKIQLARLAHSGGGDTVPGALTNLARAAREKLKLRVAALPEDLSPLDGRLLDQQLVVMHGRHNFSFSTAERQALRTYCQRGGVLLIDAICSSQAFADAVQRELREVFPEQREPLGRIPVDHDLFSTRLGGDDLRVVSRRQPERAAADGPLVAAVRRGEPLLEGVRLDGRYVVIFSRYDLSCALENRDSLECAGYTRQDAARLALNVLLYALRQ